MIDLICRRLISSFTDVSFMRLFSPNRLTAHTLRQHLTVHTFAHRLPANWLVRIQSMASTGAIWGSVPCPRTLWWSHLWLLHVNLMEEHPQPQLARCNGGLGEDFVVAVPQLATGANWKRGLIATPLSSALKVNCNPSKCVFPGVVGWGSIKPFAFVWSLKDCLGWCHLSQRQLRLKFTKKENKSGGVEFERWELSRSL